MVTAGAGVVSTNSATAKTQTLIFRREFQGQVDELKDGRGKFDKFDKA